MKLTGDITVSLPYSLDFCAKGPDVEPLVFSILGIDTTLYFPPSMSEGTIGKSFFSSGWAWWTGTTLRLTLSRPIDGSAFDVDETRSEFVNCANTILRKFINSYRVNFHRADIYPVLIDPKDLLMEVDYENGQRASLPEPNESFFYRSIPENAPLEKSINATTLFQLKADIVSAEHCSLNKLLKLDAAWAESLGDHERALAILTLIRQTDDNPG